MSSEDSNNDCKCLCYTNAEYTLILYNDQEVPQESSSTTSDTGGLEKIEAGLLDIVEAFFESIKAKEYNLNPKNFAVGLTVHEARLMEGVSKLPMIVTLQQHLNAIQGSNSLDLTISKYLQKCTTLISSWTAKTMARCG